GVGTRPARYKAARCGVRTVVAGRPLPLEGRARPTVREAPVFESLSDRLSGIFSKLRGKGRLSDADIDATAREIRLALLEADVALPVVKAFIGRLKERAR